MSFSSKNGKSLVKACIESILEKTVYQNYEILLIDNGSDETESLEYFAKLNKHPKVRVLSYPGEFNYSAINGMFFLQCIKILNSFKLIKLNGIWLAAVAVCNRR